MNSLMNTDTKEKTTISSMEVAEMVGKDHNKLLRDIRGYIEQLGESKIGHTDFFRESTYQSEQNKTLPCFEVTKKGCEFIANKLNGVKGTEFTARFINRFHDMEDYIIEEKVEEKPRLQDVNDAAMILQNVYSGLGVDKRYIAVMVGGIYKESGFNILLPPIKMEEDKIYDLTAIASELNVLSSAGKPHAQAIGAIIGMLDIAEEDKINTPYTHNGHSGVTVQYKKNVLGMVKNWLEGNDYPTTIKSNNKSYNVVYK